MLNKKKLISIIILLVFLLFGTGILLSSTADTSRAPPQPREVPGLREAPEIPVDSIPLRHDLPDHPHGASSETEEPAETTDPQ